MKTLIYSALILISIFIGYNIFFNKSSANDASDGLDLKAATDLAIKSHDAADFEIQLNNPLKKINNLDLDEDGKIDFIKVTEINTDKTKGFSLTVDVSNNGVIEEQEVATIQLDQKDDTALVETRGNNHIYGNNYYYHRRYGLADILIWNYLSSRHSRYHSPYRSGFRPSSFSESAPIDKKQYKDHHENQSYASRFQQSSTTSTSTPLVSPNRNKVASNIKAPLRNPSASQRSFQTKNLSRSIRTGSYSSSRTGSSFGGGK